MVKTPKYGIVERNPIKIPSINNKTTALLGRDTSSPLKIITINNENLRISQIIDAVTSIMVDERADGLSTAEIKIHNEDSSLTNSEILKEHNVVQIWTGFSGTKLVKRGSFRINKVKTRFAGGVNQEIILYCVSPEFDMMHTQRRAVWERKTDSQIAREIADKYGFDILVQDTNVTNDHILQANESDIKFLEKRALLYGYDVYVDEQFASPGKARMVLHFHEPIFFNPIIQTLVGGEKEGSTLEWFEIESDTWFRGVKYNATQVNPLTKENISVTSSEDKETKFQKELVGKRKIRRASDVSRLRIGNEEEQPEQFLIQQGHSRNRSEVQRQAQKFSEFTRYGLKGEGKIVGIEEISRRRVLRLLGIGRFSGDYYVTRATHTIDHNAYDLRFTVIALGPGEYDERSRGPLFANLSAFFKGNLFSATKDFFTDLIRNTPVVLGNVFSGPSSNSVIG